MANTIKGTISSIDTLLCRVTKLLTRSKKQVLDNYGLTYSQFEILSAIHSLIANKQGIIQIDISEKTGIDPMTTSTILRNLEKKVLITRMRGIENTRAVYIELTILGNDVYQQAFGEIVSLSESVYSNIDENSLSKQLFLLSTELSKINN